MDYDYIKIDSYNAMGAVIATDTLYPKLPGGVTATCPYYQMAPKGSVGSWYYTIGSDGNVWIVEVESKDLPNQAQALAGQDFGGGG